MAYTTIDDPSAYFQNLLWTGNGSNRSLTFNGNSDLQPNWSWIKQRSGNNYFTLTDSVRGLNKQIYSNATDTEATQTTNITAYNSNGVSLGTDSNLNGSGSTYVGWFWKAGTSVSGNTTGSGTAKAYSGSVNTDAGFSIIKYVGNQAAGHTIPHHLGAVPRMLIVKRLDPDASAWHVYNGSLGATKRISLNTADAQDADGTAWNNTTPTSSVFTVGDSGTTNTNNANIIAYCFAEKKGYSKFGTYVGNGNADGTFLYTGFKPAWVLFKNSGTANRQWQLLDNKRSSAGGNNVINITISPNNARDESWWGTNTYADFLSNGFKLRNSYDGVNESGGTYVYMAFAENPFTTSSGIPACAR